MVGETESNDLSAQAASSNDNNGSDYAIEAAVDQLVSIFQFNPRKARQAVDAVGTDIQSAYNWILDHGLDEDKGGPVIPIEDCPHIEKHVILSPSDLQLGLPCGYYDDEEECNSFNQKSDDLDRCPSVENWICLECNATRCSRYVNGHCKCHWLYTRDKVRQENPGKKVDENSWVGHCIAVSVTDLSVWCYECDTYIRHPLLKPITNHLELLKFGGKEEE
jgi:uncharacterized UBP type Zn finger protein